MVVKELQVQNQLGFHARVASRITRCASGFESLVCVKKNGKSYDLKSVTGELFQLKIKADEGTDDLFSMERKVYLVFFSNKVQINKSAVFTIQRSKLISSEYTFDGQPPILMIKRKENI